MKNNLRAIRKHRNKTLREVAEDINVSYQSISHYENGIRVPTIDVINKLATYYQVDANLLFPNDDSFPLSDVIYDSEPSSEEYKKYYNPIKKIAVFSEIDSHDLTTHKNKIIDQDYIYRFGTGTGSYFGFLIQTDDFLPLCSNKDILIFRHAHGLVTSNQNKHNRIFLSIEKDNSNRLYKMSCNTDVYLVDIVTNEVFSYSSFERSKIVGQLIEIHRRIEF